MTLKTLRENFIKKHKLDEDYFSGSHGQEEGLFNDQEIFFPKTIHRSHAHQAKPKCLTGKDKQKYVK